jgi:hypothetical protein
MKLVPALLAAAAVTLLAGRAHAGDDDEVPEFKIAGWYAKPGLALGGVVLRDRGAGFVVGPAFSLVHVGEEDEPKWYGLQADLLADTNGEADLGWRWSIGPQAGYVLLGGDISYFGEYVGDSLYHGVSGRAKLTFGFLGFYAKFAHVFDSPDGDSLELGLYGKIPIPLSED